MAFLHANYAAPDRGVHPAAYGRVVSYQWIRAESYYYFSYNIYHDEVAAGGRNGGIPMVQPTHSQSFVVRDTPAVLGADGVTVVAPATTYYTDLFSDAALRLSGRTPQRACYAYILIQPVGVGAVLVP